MERDKPQPDTQTSYISPWKVSSGGQPSLSLRFLLPAQLVAVSSLFYDGGAGGRDQGTVTPANSYVMALDGEQETHRADRRSPMAQTLRFLAANPVIFFQARWLKPIDRYPPRSGAHSASPVWQPLFNGRVIFTKSSQVPTASTGREKGQSEEAEPSHRSCDAV